MIVETLDAHSSGAWRVTLAHANYMPERRFVSVDRDGGGDEWVVGFSDDADEAVRLFESVCLVVDVLTMGRGESVEWIHNAEGFPL